MKVGFEEAQTPYASGLQSARHGPNVGCTIGYIVRIAAAKSSIPFPITVRSRISSAALVRKSTNLRVKRASSSTRCLMARFVLNVNVLAANNNPNLFLLNYDLKQLSVTDLFVVPKHFFVREIIEKRKPLATTARRAGWIGSDILLSQVPQSGKIFIVRGVQPQPKESVLARWRSTLFLRDQGPEARGWLIEVMKCVETIGKREFRIDDIYAFEDRLSLLYPGNQNMRPKIRQQLQFLRDRGYLDFVSRGNYRLRSESKMA